MAKSKSPKAKPEVIDPTVDPIAETADAINPRLVIHDDANLVIQAIDSPSNGGASHRYDIAAMGQATAGEDGAQVRQPVASTMLEFQRGPIAESGFNGITNESLITVLIDRLDWFQSGSCPCPENAMARECLVQALGWLTERTKARRARGVEGTETP